VSGGGKGVVGNFKDCESGTGRETGGFSRERGGGGGFEEGSQEPCRGEGQKASTYPAEVDGWCAKGIISKKLAVVAFVLYRATLPSSILYTLA
jgi:hypothetical protein